MEIYVQHQDSICTGFEKFPTATFLDGEFRSSISSGNLFINVRSFTVGHDLKKRVLSTSRPPINRLFNDESTDDEHLKW